MQSAKTLAKMSPQEIKALKANILTEHFGWAPESFVKQGMDLANVSLYAATDAIEQALLEKSGPPHNLDPVKIQKGVYSLETLLENSIDRHFDAYELYVLRNTFYFETELIPYISLAHQDQLDESLRDADQSAVDEYEEELRLYEEELEKERQLACAAEFVRRKLEDVRERAHEVGYMSGTEPLSSRTQGVVSQLSLLQDRLTVLLDTPTARVESGTPSAADPWGTSRSRYVNWAASSKVDTLPVTGAASGEDAAMKVIGETIRKAGGSNEDAQALLDSLGTGSAP